MLRVHVPPPFISEKQREDRGPFSSQMWHSGLTDADPARSAGMRLLSPYLGQMSHDQHPLAQRENVTEWRRVIKLSMLHEDKLNYSYSSSPGNPYLLG